jgi:hypothetical protein
VNAVRIKRHNLRSDSNLRLRLALVALTIFCGCQHREILKVHYLPGFVPGTRNLFAAKALLIALPKNARTIEAGAIYDDQSRLVRRLWVRNASATAGEALQRGFSDAGLKTGLDDAPEITRPPAGYDYLLRFRVTKFGVIKKFGRNVTVHGRYFAMKADVRLEAEVFDDAGKQILSGESTGNEQEPPQPVGGEVFLPLEEDPAESLSVAMSRAVGALVLEVAKRKIFPAAR